jgi:hypothetical protein
MRRRQGFCRRIEILKRNEYKQMTVEEKPRIVQKWRDAKRN